MEKAEMIAIIVVAVIASAELFCLFICSKLKNKSYPLCVVLPVTAQDKELGQQLEYIVSIIEGGSTFIGTVLLIDIDGTQEQLELCSDFCTHYHSMELIKIADIEKHLKN